MKKAGGGFFLGVLVFSFLLCTPDGDSWAQEKTVAYLSLADYTGAIAGLNVPADMGVEDYFKELNARGGVEGV